MTDRAGVARQLWLERAAGEVAAAMRMREVDPMLLKGPVLQRLLYGTSELRRYGDIDLLVSPTDRGRAEESLVELGFVQVVNDRDFPGHAPLHASPWRRDDAFGSAIDLHTSLPEVDADPDLVWRELSARTESIPVGAERLRALDPVASALLVSLHAAHHGRAAPRPLADLERAVSRLPRESWEEASRLAARLDAAPAFAAGLRLCARGGRLADSLALDSQGDLELMLKVRSAPPLAAGLARLRHADGAAAKLRLATRALAPTRSWMRWRFPLARRGRLGLVASYACLPGWILLNLPGALLALWRAQREASRPG